MPKKKAAILLPALAAAIAAAAWAHDRAPAPADLPRALGVLQYLVGDYSEAVGDDGRIVNEDEYAEQLEFLAQVDSILAGSAGGARAAVLSDLRAVHGLVIERRPPDVVVPRLQKLHSAIVRAWDVRLTPSAIPSLEVGKLVYEQSCVQCHGEDGRARVPGVEDLVPPPRDFTAPERDAVLSPYAVFSAVTFGIEGTAMSSFEALPEEERWSLAFYVLALRHPAGPPAEPPPAGVPSLRVRDLALATDADLRARLAALPQSSRAPQLARWRWVMPLEVE